MSYDFFMFVLYVDYLPTTVSYLNPEVTVQEFRLQKS